MRKRLETTFDIQTAGLTHVGRVRRCNDDVVLVDARRGLCVVADGMGGHNAGNLASRVAAEQVARCLTANRLAGLRGRPARLERALKAALWMAHGAVRAAARANSACAGMGSTLVVALLDGLVMHVCHVGDSRVYVSGPKGMERLTTDHSTVMDLVRDGRMTIEQARHSPLKNQLTQAIGASVVIRPQYRRRTIAAGEKVLLCSDGLWDMLTDVQIHAIVSQLKDPAAICGDLIAAANAAGGADNISAVVAACAPRPHTP